MSLTRASFKVGKRLPVALYAVTALPTSYQYMFSRSFSVKPLHRDRNLTSRYGSKMPNYKSNAPNVNTEEDLLIMLQGKLDTYDFKSILESMVAKNMNRSMFSTDAVKSICRHIAAMEKDLPNFILKLLFLFSQLELSVKDFDNHTVEILSISCEKTIKYNAMHVFKALNGINRVNLLDEYLLKVIDEALYISLPNADNFEVINVFRNLGHMEVSWFSLSDETKSALLTGLSRCIPMMDTKELQHLLFNIHVMNGNSYEMRPVNEILLSAIDTRTDNIDELMLGKFFSNLSQLKYTFQMLSPTLRTKMENAFLIRLRNGDRFALRNLYLMNNDYETLSPQLQAVLIPELVNFLADTSTETFQFTLKAVAEMGLKWNEFPPTEQRRFGHLIVKGSNNLSDRVKYVLFSSLFRSLTEFNDLPHQIKFLLYDHLIYANNVERAKFSAIIKIMCQWNLQYKHFNERLRENLNFTLMQRLSNLKMSELLEVLNGLCMIGMKPQHFDEAVRKEILTCVKRIEHNEHLSEAMNNLLNRE